MIEGMWRISAFLILAGLPACKVESKPPAIDTTGSSDPKVTSTAAVGTSSVSGARIAVPHAGPPGEWQMPAGDYASSRYSELATITPENVANLHVAWAFSTGVLRGHEGQPLASSRGTPPGIGPFPRREDVARALGEPAPRFVLVLQPDERRQHVGEPPAGGSQLHPHQLVGLFSARMSR